MGSQNLAAIIPSQNARLTLETRPVPKPGPHELLIRNHAIAANPVDWKIQDYDFFIKSYPTVLGSDVCGTVEAVGSEVENFKKGDRVTGYAGVIYNNDINHGAWQTYPLLRDISTAKIPDSMSFEEGAVFPMAIATAGIALFIDLGIPRPPAKTTDKEALLIWGGSSSVGTAAIQIAKTLGLKVYTTASASNHSYLQNLGANQVFDYRDSNVVSKIIETAKKDGIKITKAFDTISENGTSVLVAKVLGANGGGTMAVTLDDKAKVPEVVKVVQTGAYRIATDQAEFGEWLFNKFLTDALAKGDIVPAPPVQVVSGGVGAAQEVFDKLKAGVSMKKLVVKVD